MLYCWNWKQKWTNKFKSSVIKLARGVGWGEVGWYKGVWGGHLQMRRERERKVDCTLKVFGSLQTEPANNHHQ